VQQGITALPEILKTNYVHGYHNATSTMYRPFTSSMFAIEWSLSPNNPFIGHFINCLFFAFTAVVLFLLLGRMFKKQHPAIPFLVTLLFIVHPIHTEVVANIKSRDELMSFFCAAVSMLFLFKYLDERKMIQLGLVGLFYFSALMFKESAATLLVIFPLLLYFFTDSKKKDYLVTGAVVAAVLLLQVAIRTSVLADQTGMQTLFLKIHNSLVTAADANERTASTLMILGRYIVLLFFPYPLSCDYSYNEIALVRWNSPWAYLSLLVYAGLFFVIVKRFRKKEAWVFGIIYYLATMVLYSNILFPVGATLGERFLYIPSFGFCIVIVTGLMKLFPGSAGNNMKSIAAGLRQAALPSAVIFIVSVILVIKTIDRNDDWQNNMELFGADVKKNPNSAPLNYLYGNEILQQRALLQQDSLLKRKMMDTVITYFNKAITIYPEYGDAYSQRALAYFRTDRYDQSAEDYKRSIYDYKV
jgi:tetratricopeptide (TPR) repeat protein